MAHPLSSTSWTVLLVSLKLKHRLTFMPNFPVGVAKKKQNWVILSCLVCKWMSLITIWLGEVGSQLIFLAVDDLLYFVLPTNHLQVDERCLIPAYEITLGTIHILRKHIFSLFRPPLSLISKVIFSTLSYPRIMSHSCIWNNIRERS